MKPLSTSLMHLMTRRMSTNSTGLSALSTYIRPIRAENFCLVRSWNGESFYDQMIVVGDENYDIHMTSTHRRLRVVGDGQTQHG